MAIRDISLGTSNSPHDKAFNRSTWALTNLYISYLANFNTGGIVKIFISVINPESININSPIYLFNKPLKLINVITIPVVLDIEYYTNLDEHHKSLLQLEIIHSACLHACTSLEWNEEPFHKSYEECLKANLTNAWVINIKKRFFPSPNRILTACLICQWTLNKFEVDVVFMSRTSNVNKIITIVSNEPYNYEIFSAITWINNEILQVQFKNGKVISISCLD